MYAITLFLYAILKYHLNAIMHNKSITITAMKAPSREWITGSTFCKMEMVK